MTNSEKLRQSTELLAARGEGFADGLRWVMRLVKGEKYDCEAFGTLEANHIVFNAHDLESSIKAKLENKNGQGTSKTQTAEEEG